MNFTKETFEDPLRNNQVQMMVLIHQIDDIRSKIGEFKKKDPTIPKEFHFHELNIRGTNCIFLYKVTRALFSHSPGSGYAACHMHAQWRPVSPGMPWTPFNLDMSMYLKSLKIV